MPQPRLIFLGIFAVCTGLIAFALYLQHAQGLEPCPMCILQRYAFILTGAIALAAAIHAPRRTGSWIYSLAILLSAGSGAGVAARHAWLERNPPRIFDCGADLGYMMESLPLAEVLPMIFRGTGDCSKVLWRFAGLSIAEWALVWFLIFIAAALAAALIRPREAGR
ncbi:MAG TPA: disulfide bond formation protein B [Burkholderiales bacterium]|jgi:disulfide bond formation protein DsbB|nr:disulfide bond formation protein B [Burkholderiales bacterium]